LILIVLLWLRLIWRVFRWRGSWSKWCFCLPSWIVRIFNTKRSIFRKVFFILFLILFSSVILIFFFSIILLFLTRLVRSLLIHLRIELALLLDDFLHRYHYVFTILLIDKKLRFSSLILSLTSLISALLDCFIGNVKILHYLICIGFVHRAAHEAF
jgi:hypothetical protein